MQHPNKMARAGIHQHGCEHENDMNMKLNMSAFQNQEGAVEKMFSFLQKLHFVESLLFCVCFLGKMMMLSKNYAEK